MSILHGQPPPYSDAQVLSNVVTVSAISVSEANLQQNILNLAAQDPTNLPQNLQLPNDIAQNPEDAAHFDTFKQNIYRHPLFPLLAMVFEKCENSTHSPDLASHNFEKEVQAFMNHHENLKTPILGIDDEVNELMIKAIQVLRIHLMEIEKVNELCKDFCTRYISCLKGKLTSEQLLHVDGCDSPEPQDLNQSSPALVSLNSAMQIQQPPLVTSTVVGGNVVLQQQQPQIVSGNTVYQMVHTPQGIVAQPIQIQGPLTPLNQPVQQVIHGSTPLSQIGVSLSSPSHQQQQQIQQHVQQPQPQQIQQQQQHQVDMKSGIHRMSDDDDDDKNSKQKRGILPKQATQVMKSWLFQHIVHPYPTEDEKRQIAAQTNLTLLQVNNWFINARRRILQPMLEASNPDKAKNKKPSKPGNKPQQRFWPIHPSNSMKEEKQEVEEEEPKPKTPPTSTPKKAASTAAVAVSSAAALGVTSTMTTERVPHQIIAADPTLTSQHEALMGCMSNGGLVLKLSPDGQIIPSTSMATSIPTSITLESLQALQSGGFVFAPGPTPLPFSLPLSTLSPSAGAGLGLGVGPFSGLTASPMTLSALNFAASPYATPLQFAGCINAAPIDLSTMSNPTAVHLSTLAGAHMAHHGAGAGQVLMGVTLQDANGDQSLDDADESPEVGELKIDTREVRGLHDIGNG